MLWGFLCENNKTYPFLGTNIYGLSSCRSIKMSAIINMIKFATILVNSYDFSNVLNIKLINFASQQEKNITFVPLDLLMSRVSIFIQFEVAQWYEEKIVLKSPSVFGTCFCIGTYINKIIVKFICNIYVV